MGEDGDVPGCGLKFSISFILGSYFAYFVSTDTIAIPNIGRRYSFLFSQSVLDLFFEGQWNPGWDYMMVPGSTGMESGVGRRYLHSVAGCRYLVFACSFGGFE